MLLPFDFAKLPRPDKTQPSRPDAFVFTTVATKVCTETGLQRIDKTGNNGSVGGGRRIRKTEVNAQGQYSSIGVRYTVEGIGDALLPLRIEGVTH